MFYIEKVYLAVVDHNNLYVPIGPYVNYVPFCSIFCFFCLFFYFSLVGLFFQIVYPFFFFFASCFEASRIDHSVISKDICDCYSCFSSDSNRDRPLSFQVPLLSRQLSDCLFWYLLIPSINPVVTPEILMHILVLSRSTCTNAPGFPGQSKDLRTF